MMASFNSFGMDVVTVFSTVQMPASVLVLSGRRQYENEIFLFPLLAFSPRLAENLHKAILKC